MVNSGTLLGQIGESFETIGKDVARETVQAPKDIVGTALESLGVSSGSKKPKQNVQASQPGQENTGEAVPQAGPTDEVKRAIARAALEELSGKSKPKELSVWERIQKDEEQKKEMEKKQKEQAVKQALPKSSSKRPRGDLYGMKAKKSQVENRNVRQD